jgi:hypothetical protein
LTKLFVQVKSSPGVSPQEVFWSSAERDSTISSYLLYLIKEWFRPDGLPKKNKKSRKEKKKRKNKCVTAGSIYTELFLLIH